MLGFATTVFFIDEQSVRRRLFSQRNCRTLAGAETLIYGHEVASRPLDLQPIGEMSNPLLRNGWRPFFAEFSDDSRRDQDTAVENGAGRGCARLRTR